MKRICLVSRSDSLVLREYTAALTGSKHKLFLLELPASPATVRFEMQRTRSLWVAPVLYLDVFEDVLTVESFSDDRIREWIVANKIELLVQSGCGIVRGDILIENIWLNLHPGRIPEFRGCCAPEWQILENKPIYSCAHLMTEFIDAGSIVAEKRLVFPWVESLAELRSHLYSLQASFLRETVDIVPTEAYYTNSSFDLNSFLDYPMRSVPSEADFFNVELLLPTWQERYM